MKIFSTILVTVTLLVIGLLFLSSGNNADKNVSKSSVKKIQNDEYHSQYKRRDFIRERRENERKEINSQNARLDDARRRHEDFMVYNRPDDNRGRHDDFR
jgi:hypothetical protein